MRHGHMDECEIGTDCEVFRWNWYHLKMNQAFDLSRSLGVFKLFLNADGLEVVWFILDMF